MHISLSLLFSVLRGSSQFSFLYAKFSVLFSFLFAFRLSVLINLCVVINSVLPTLCKFSIFFLYAQFSVIFSFLFAYLLICFNYSMRSSRFCSPNNVPILNFLSLCSVLGSFFFPFCLPAHLFSLLCAHFSNLFSQLCASSQYSIFMHSFQFCYLSSALTSHLFSLLCARALLTHFLSQFFNPYFRALFSTSVINY
jgi:hypothetical protein